jgi:hypothetical protein
MAHEAGPKIFKCMRLGMPSLSLNSRGVLQLGPSTYAVAKAIAAAGTSKPGQRPMPSTSA